MDAPRRLAPSAVVACAPLRATLSAASCATRHAALWPSGRRKGTRRFQPCGTCPFGRAVLLRLRRSGWEPPPASQPPEVLPEAQRAACAVWVRSWPAWREPLEELRDPVQLAAHSTPDDHGLAVNGDGSG